MRGAPNLAAVVCLTGRIIPAYAGSTQHRNSCQSAHRDHPRVCGEHQVVMRATLPLRGSSPRMRGAPRDGANPEADLRIIPAYAGSTGDFAWGTDENEDHPRVCGEHHVRGSDVARAEGSSPRMRGALANRSAARWRQGCAVRDHPRVCGEHSAPEVRSCHSSGSSPRMRGARARHLGAEAGQRIIPAYAGSTKALCTRTAGRTDHPRVCGEHRWARLATSCARGSSPRMRGAHSEMRRRVQAGRIIPAYAGSTTNPHSTPTTLEDHPRVCGEHDLGGQLGASVHRIIPAYAGSTA